MLMVIYVYQMNVYFIINGAIKENILILTSKKVTDGTIQKLRLDGRIKKPILSKRDKAAKVL